MPAQMLKAINVCVFIKAKKNTLSFQICELSHLSRLWSCFWKYSKNYLGRGFGLYA